MKAEYPSIDRFIQAWIAEFSRAVEMFSGQALEVRYSPTKENSIPQSDSALWVKQVFVDSGSFQTWVGAQEATWASLGGSLGEGSPETLRSTYLEIVNQAQQGSASVINSDCAKAIRCEDPETFVTANFDAGDFITFDLDLVGAGIPAISFAIERLAAEVLAVNETSEFVAIESTQETPPLILSSLLTLQLPVSVSLGQSQVEMKKVLLAGPGSVIPLDKDVSEPVDLLVHGKVVARGDVVLVKGNYGFRVRQIISRQNRLTVCNG